MQVVGADDDIFKRSTKEALSWATPRAPFEVCCLFLSMLPWGSVRCWAHVRSVKGWFAWDSVSDWLQVTFMSQPSQNLGECLYG